MGRPGVHQGGAGRKGAAAASDVSSRCRDTPAGRGFRRVAAESRTDPRSAAALSANFARRRLDFAAAVERPGADPEAIGAVRDLLTGFNLGRLLTGGIDDPEAVAAVAHLPAAGLERIDPPAG